MIQLFSSTNKQFLKSVQKSEIELNKFLSENWGYFFPQLVFIKREFSLDGNVRSKGTSGRIDILAFNLITKKFVIVELKRDLNKNIRNQASDYKDFIEDNFADIYLLATQTYNIELPKHKNISQDNIELILIAKEFNPSDVEKAIKSKGEITLIKYRWFEGDLLFFNYLNNNPAELIEKNKPIIKVEQQPLSPTTKKLLHGDKFKIENPKRGVNAHGQMLSDGTIMVLKDSTISFETSLDFQNSCSNAFEERNRLERNRIIKDRIFSEDTIFNSKSLAAKVILGYSVSGPKIWESE